jgi:hypothetical protein
MLLAGKVELAPETVVIYCWWSRRADRTWSCRECWLAEGEMRDNLNLGPVTLSESLAKYIVNFVSIKPGLVDKARI